MFQECAGMVRLTELKMTNGEESKKMDSCPCLRRGDIIGRSHVVAPTNEMVCPASQSYAAGTTVHPTGN
jgi:hypothetical protein